MEKKKRTDPIDFLIDNLKKMDFEFFKKYLLDRYLKGRKGQAIRKNTKEITILRMEELVREITTAFWDQSDCFIKNPFLLAILYNETFSEDGTNYKGVRAFIKSFEKQTGKTIDPFRQPYFSVYVNHFGRNWEKHYKADMKKSKATWDSINFIYQAERMLSGDDENYHLDKGFIKEYCDKFVKF